MNSNLSRARLLGGIGAIISMFGGITPIFSISFTKEIDGDVITNMGGGALASFLGVVGVIGIILVMVSVNLISRETRDKEIFSKYLTYFLLTILSLVAVIIPIAGLIIMWVCWIIGALYLKRCYYSISDHTEVNLFRTTGLLYLIGTITLIFIVGVIIIVVARILEAVSYFSLPDELPGSLTS